MVTQLRATTQSPEFRRGRAIARCFATLGLMAILALQSAGPAKASALGPTPSSIAPPPPERPRVLFGGEVRTASIASLELPLVTPEDLPRGNVEDPAAAAGSALTPQLIQFARQGLQFIATFMRSIP